jgi:uncharacterized repeat protein (TIGR01451 family)
MTIKVSGPEIVSAGWQRLGLVVAIVVASLVLLSLSGIGARTLAADSAPLTVEMTAFQSGDTVSYSITLINNTESDIAQIFIAGLVPSGTTFSKATATPSGSWFRGFEAAGTDIQSAVWLSEKVPAGGKQGPFSYEVKVSDTVGPAHTWVHWLIPSDGTAVSASILPKVYGLAQGQRYHKIHAGQLGLGCTTCHKSQVSDPEAIFITQDVSPLAPGPVDRKACLTCHRSSGPGPTFYGG